MTHGMTWLKRRSLSRRCTRRENARVVKCLEDGNRKGERSALLYLAQPIAEIYTFDKLLLLLLLLLASCRKKLQGSKSR